MRPIISIICKSYRSYKGDLANHKFRMLIIVIFSGYIASANDGLSGSAIEMMAVTLSVLTGFTFTAMFSFYSVTLDDLPEAEDENDRNDRSRLSKLETNFTARSNALIPSSIFVLGCLILLSVDAFSATASTRYLYDLMVPKETIIRAEATLNTIWQVGAWLVRFLALVVFVETIYTFYRLTETVTAAFKIRSDYTRSKRIKEE